MIQLCWLCFSPVEPSVLPKKTTHTSVPGPGSNKICLIMDWVHCQTMRLPIFYIQYLVFETLKTNLFSKMLFDLSVKKIIRWTAKSWLLPDMIATAEKGHIFQPNFTKKTRLEVILKVQKPAKALENVAPSSTEQDLSLVRLPFHHVPSLQSSQVGGSLVFHRVLFVWN